VGIIGAILHGQPAIISMIVSGIEKQHVDITRIRILDRDNQSERTIVCLPETNARPLLAISDPIIKEKAIIKCMERLNGEIGAGMAGCIALHYYSVVWLAVCAQSIVWFCERCPHSIEKKV